MSATATPPPTPATIPDEAKNIADAFKMDLKETFKDILKDPADKKIEPVPDPNAPAPEPEMSNLSDILARKKAFAPATPDGNKAATTPAAPAATAAATTPAPETKVDVTPAAPAAPVQVVASTTDELKSSLNDLAAGMEKLHKTVSAQPAAAPATEPAAPDDEQAYIEGLTEEQKEEIELAKFAAEEMPERYKDQSKKLVAFYKKLDDFVKENPETEKEELDKFILDNRPKYQGGDKRKIDISLVTKKAEERVQQRMSKEIEKTQRRVYELETRPAVKAAHQTFVKTMEAGQVKVPEGVPVIDKEIVLAVTTQGGEMEIVDGVPVPKAALKKHRIEAVPVAKAVALSEEFLNLRSNLSPYDLQRPLCYKVAEFLHHQSENFMRRPAEQRTLPDGRTFAPYLAYSGMNQQDRAKHFTFTDEQVLSMLATTAALEINNELKNLQESGFTRVAAPKPAGTAPAETPAPAAPASVPSGTPSPVFGGSGSPMAGATVSTPSTSPHAEVFRRLGLPVPA